METIMISSAANQKVKRIVQLNKKSSQRRLEKVFIVEGIKMFLEAPEEYLEEVYVSESFGEEVQKEGQEQRRLLEKMNMTGYETVSDEIFTKISDTQAPQGILCVVRQRYFTLEQMLEQRHGDGQGNAHFMILENLQDPGNLGTIMRTGEGAGISGIIMSRDTVDVYNPKTIRATMGSVYRVPFLYADSLEETVGAMKKCGISVYAAHLKGEKSYDRCDYTEAAAFLIGNEGNGLTERTAALADTYVKIPMEGQLESLNAAVAAALLMYETARQRRTDGISGASVCK